MPIKEIEVKAKVRDKEVLISAFKKEGILFGEEVFQDDKVFINYPGAYKSFPLDAIFLRIRKTGGKVLFTLKQSQKHQLSKIEKEVEVSDANTVSDICSFLGFREALEIKKHRIKSHFGEYEICIDEVEGLGSFVEVEKMSDEDDEKVFEELFSFLEKFGVKREDRILVGYDILVAEKMGI